MDSTDRIELPSEIWSEIFLYLRLADRKNIRLTCHRFNDLCNDHRFQMKEVIAFRVKDSDMDARIHCLAKTCKKIRNIKLCNDAPVDHTILPLFEGQGSNLRSLVIDNCRFTDGTFKSIIEYCDGLEHITLKVLYVHAFAGNRHVKNVLKDSEVLKSLSIVRPTVVDLKLRIPSNHNLSGIEFSLFFDIFPSVKRLDLEIDMTEKSDDFLPPPALVSHLHDRIFSISDQLEKLRLRFNYCRNHYSSSLSEMVVKISQIRLKNLRKLSLNWICYRPDISELNPVLKFPQLTHLNLDLLPASPSFSSPLLIPDFLKLLLSKTRLESLSISGNSLLITRELFEAFVYSKLTTLHIYMFCSLGIRTDFPSSSLENNLTPNYHLQDIRIDEACCDVACLFYTYFRNVVYLRFPEVHDVALSTAFELGRKFYDLTLSNCEGAPYSSCVLRELPFYQQWLETKKTSIKRELECLTTLKMSEYKFTLTNFILSEFIFSKLKNLIILIHDETQFDKEKFVRLLHNLPRLENLNLDLPVSIAYPKWLALINSLTKLRDFKLILQGENLFNESQYLELFDVRSSLCLVMHQVRKALPLPTTRFTTTYMHYARSSNNEVRRVRFRI